jgi:hypothetical protein
VTGGEHQAGVDPGIPCALAVGVLLLPAELERGDTQAWEEERCFGCLGLGLAAQELAADALKLLTDVEFGAVEVGLTELLWRFSVSWISQENRCAGLRTDTPHSAHARSADAHFCRTHSGHLRAGR